MAMSEIATPSPERNRDISCRRYPKVRALAFDRDRGSDKLHTILSAYAEKISLFFMRLSLCLALVGKEFEKQRVRYARVDHMRFLDALFQSWIHAFTLGIMPSWTTLLSINPTVRRA
jgi:hypothetical protein